MITWNDIKDLPKEHPLYIAFMEQNEHECGCYNLSDEEVKEYFASTVPTDSENAY
jgi:hypothetical protein